MPGPRQTLSVIEGKGKKHLSKKEKADRKDSDVVLPKPKSLKVPGWLPEEYRKAFRALSKELLKADMGIAQLDADTVGRYVVAVALYEETTSHVNEMMAYSAQRRGDLMAKMGEALAEEKPDPLFTAQILRELVGMEVAVVKGVSETIKQQNTYFAQARACANDLGMTVTSRCRLVLPESSKPKEENAFEKLMKERQQRRA